MKYSLYILLLLSLLSSCRQVDEMTGNRPIVDTKGVDPEVYEADLQECYVFADRSTGRTQSRYRGRYGAL